MKRREQPEEPGAMPERLRRFSILDEQWHEPADALEDDLLMREIYARKRWEAAGRKWLEAQGRDPKDWYELTRPGPVVDRP